MCVEIFVHRSPVDPYDIRIQIIRTNISVMTNPYLFQYQTKQKFFF